MAPTSRDQRRSLPLERKLPLLILALFSVVLGVSLGVSYYEVRHAAELAAGERLAGLSKVLGTLVEQQTGARGALLRRIAHDTAVQAALRTPDRPIGASVQKALSPLMASRTDSTTPPSLWTRDAQPVGELQLELPADASRFRDELRRHGRGTDPDTSLIVSDIRPVGDHAASWMAMPSHDADGRLLGYIVQERRVASNPRALQPLRDLMGHDIDLHFRNADDNTWVQLSGVTAPPPIASESFLDSLQLITRASGQALSASVPIRGTPYLITVERPLSAILDRPLAAIRILATMAILLAVVGAAFAWIISRGMVRPLGELTGASEAMAGGQYSKRVEIKRGDEIGRLGQAFNRMAEQVSESSLASAEAVSRLTASVERETLLAEASRILAGSLSDETLLTDLAHYCVPRMADYCTIHILEENGTIRRIETVSYDASKQDAVKALVARYPYRVDGPGEVPRVIRTQEPVLAPELDFDAIKRAAHDQTTEQLLGMVHPTSFMCVPLVARGRALGAMSFTMTDSGRRFSEVDLGIAMELSRRAAVAIDNALIYRRSIALRMEAEAASNAKSDFLAKMSHEIRTPINAMMGYAELMEMGLSGPVTEAQSKQLSRIRASGDHLTSLIGEILDLAKIEAGRMVVQPTIGIAGDAVDAALALIRPQANTKGVELAMRIDGDPRVEYFGDPQRVQQILSNLLSNAVKFTEGGGTVTIGSSAAARPTLDTGDEPSLHWACITVADTGVGVAPGDLERIFQPFVQVDAGYTRAHGGTGLGLTISRSLAQLMGGDITVRSESGKGSEFALWLPCPTRVAAPVAG